MLENVNPKIYEVTERHYSRNQHEFDDNFPDIIDNGEVFGN